MARRGTDTPRAGTELMFSRTTVQKYYHTHYLVEREQTDNNIVGF